MGIGNITMNIFGSKASIKIIVKIAKIIHFPQIFAICIWWLGDFKAIIDEFQSFCISEVCSSSTYSRPNQSMLFSDQTFYFLKVLQYFFLNSHDIRDNTKKCISYIVFHFKIEMLQRSFNKKKVRMNSHWRPASNNLMKLDCQNGKSKSQNGH